MTVPERMRHLEIRWDLAALTFALAALAFLAVSGIGADLLKTSAGIPESAEGFGRIKTLANKIQTPALYFAGAMIPLVIIGGGVALMLGSRQATTWVARAVGAMFLLAVVGGLAT